MRVNWTEENTAQCRAMRKAGASWLDVGQFMGCSESAARYSLSAYRRERCQAQQRRKRMKAKASKPRLFPYVGQFDPETGRQQW